MFKFPSIEQFRNAIHHVRHQTTYRGQNESGEPIYDHNAPMPTILYRGTVKLHGTNGSIVYDYATQELTYQSRERILQLGSDNNGFMLTMSNKRPVIDRLVTHYSQGLVNPTKLAIYGEWAGPGINNGTAIHQLTNKMFVIFGVCAIYTDADGEHHRQWLPLDSAVHDADEHVFCIEQFQTFYMEIDFSKPEIAQQKLVELTDEVERACPVGQYFGVEGIGEGIVWKPINTALDSGYWFKVKGEKHSASKVKTLATIDPEKVASIREFVDNVVTEQRLLQGVEWLKTEAQKPIEVTSMGDLIRWVFNDVMKEEADTIVANQLDAKKLNGSIAAKTRSWFLTYLG